MSEVGYSAEVITEMCGSINQYNAKVDQQSAKIEIQIVSSSDAASHLVGPFVTLHWYENPTKSIPELQRDNQKKLFADWDVKITLPEVRQASESRYQAALEIAGTLSASFLS